MRKVSSGHLLPVETVYRVQYPIILFVENEGSDRLHIHAIRSGPPLFANDLKVYFYLGQLNELQCEYVAFMPFLQGRQLL